MTFETSLQHDRFHNEEEVVSQRLTVQTRVKCVSDTVLSFSKDTGTRRGNRGHRNGHDVLYGAALQPSGVPPEFCGLVDGGVAKFLVLFFYSIEPTISLRRFSNISL